jgi:glycine/D-amino acid oxidase-like deaminating enzyme
MHSGMTMCPVIGEMAAMEILDGATADILDTFRPARFA